MVAIGRRDLLGAGRALGFALGTGIAATALPTAASAASDSSDLATAGGSGDSENSPAVSAQALRTAGNTSDGWYWIRTSQMSAARRVYCNMTDEGGGWMLACYSPDHVLTGSRYPNVWTGGQGVLDRMATDVRELWFDGEGAQCTSVLKMASTLSARDPNLAAMQIANRVTYTNPGDLALNDSGDGSLTVTSTLALDGTWSAVKGHTTMSGPLVIKAPRDWVQNSNFWNVCGASSDVVATGRSTELVGTYSATRREADPLYGMANVAATASSLSRDLRSYAVYIR